MLWNLNPISQKLEAYNKSSNEEKIVGEVEGFICFI